MAPDLVQLMLKLNFSLPSASVYKALLVNGPLSPTELTNLSRQPAAHLEQTVQVLMDLQLIAKDYVRGQPQFYARDPAIAFLALETDLVWETDTSLKPARLVPSTGDPRKDELRTTCVEIIKVARRLYKPHSAALSHRVRDANTPDELMRLTCELLYHSTEVIYAASRSPRLPHVSQFWTVLTERITQGVRYHRVADLEEVIDHGLAIVTRDMSDFNIDLRVLEGDRIGHTFYLVDNRYLSTHHYMSQRQHQNHYGAGRITNQPQIVGRYKKRFLGFLENSIPGRFVVLHLREAGNELLGRASTCLSREEVEWLQDLINFGKFSTFHKTQKWDEEKIADIEERATDAGFVCKNHDGLCVPRYPTNEQKLRDTYLINTLK